jgi:ferritin-like protein
MRSSILETLPVAEILVRKLEELGMEPPGYMKPIPFINGKQYPLIPGDFQNDAGIWCTPGVNEWEPE